MGINGKSIKILSSSSSLFPSSSYSSSSTLTSFLHPPFPVHVSRAWWLLILGGMGLLALFSLGPDMSDMSAPAPAHPGAGALGVAGVVLQPVYAFSIWLFGSREMLR